MRGSASVTGLTVTVGGATAIATDDLLRLAARIDRAGDRLHDHARALALPPLVAEVTGEHDAGLDLPRQLLSSAEHDARTLAAELRRAAAEYADGERDVARCVRAASGEPGAGGPAGVVGGVLGDAAGSWADGLRLLGLGSMIAVHPHGPGRLLLPAAIRAVVSDVAAAATRFLPGRPSGDDGTRETAAGLVALLAAVGVLRDAPATVHARRDDTRPVPTGMADLAARIPDPVAGAAQMRVEEYRAPDGGRRFVAYLGGMQTLDPRTGREEFGPASATAALATESGSAVRAAEQALRDAGVTAEDEVYVVGYSMGGILARSVGDDPAFRVTHEVTFGSPVGQMPLRQGVEGASVEHVDDPVPALGGVRPSAGDAGDDVVVRSWAVDPRVPADPLAAHELGGYRVTAGEMDASRSPAVMRVRDGLHGFLEGATPVASHLYRAERGPVAPAAGTDRPR
jgi:hypothetical protein